MDNKDMGTEKASDDFAPREDEQYKSIPLPDIETGSVTMGISELRSEETLVYDEGKIPIGQLLASHPDETLAKLVEIGHWMDIDFLIDCVDVLRKGAKKYERDNWKKGTDWSKRGNSAVRHALSFLRGEDKDEELDTYHVCNETINNMMLWNWLVNGKGIDDRLDQIKNAEDAMHEEK